MTSKMKLLVTGSNGFIGSNLVKKLQNQNIHFEGLSKKKHSASFKIHICDLANNHKLKKIISKNKFNCIIHLAEISTNNDPNIIKTNLISSLNLVESCKNSMIKKIIFVSGHNVYSPSKKLPISENYPCLPTTSYGLSKLLSEKILEYYADEYNIKLVILRVSFTYGPHQHKTKMISKFISHLRNSQQINLDKYSNGYQKMDLIHVFDVCDAIISSLKSKKKIAIYNIASGKTTTIKDIIKILKNNIDSKSKIKTKLNTSKTNHFCYNISLAKKKLKFNPKITLQEGISSLTQ